MQIMVRLGEPLWRAAGAMRLYLDFDEGDVTVADVLARLSAAYPPFETAYRGVGRWTHSYFVQPPTALGAGVAIAAVSMYSDALGA